MGNNCFDGDLPPDIIMPKTQGPLHIKINLRNFAKFPLLSNNFVAEIHRDKKEKKVEKSQGAEVEAEAETEAGRRVQEARKKEEMAKKSKYFIIYYFPK